MFLSWTKLLSIILFTCSETVWSEEDCSVTIPLFRSRPYEDLTLPSDQANRRLGQKEQLFLNYLTQELHQCIESECLVIRVIPNIFQQFKICKASSACYPKKDQTTDRRATETSTTGSVIKAVKKRSCNALGIGMLVLGMGLGVVTMAIVCVFVPSLHKKTTKLLNKKAMKKRPSQSTQSTRSRQSNLSTQNNQVIQQPGAAMLNQQTLSQNEQPMYLELDQPVEQSIYQTLDHVDGQTAHVYMDLSQRPNLYNDLGDDSLKSRSVQKDNTDHNHGHSKDLVNVAKNSLPVDSTGYVIMKQTMNLRNECKDLQNEFERADARSENVNHNYFKLEKHFNQDEVKQTAVYVKLEPENQLDKDGQINNG